MNYEQDYHALLEHVIRCGDDKGSRAGPTRAVYGKALTITELAFGYFPLLTARKMYPAPILGELAAFLLGATDLQTFKNFGCNYWDENAIAWEYNNERPMNDLAVGNIYGAKWRNFHGVDQLQVLLDSIRLDPYGRRHLLTTYDPSEKWQCLPPCHLLTQFHVTIHGQLHCTVYMRSVDLCLGLPSDVVLYSGLLILVANELGYDPGYLTFMLGDAHIYANHLDQAQMQLSCPRFKSPTWRLQKNTSLFDFVPSDLEIVDYQHGEKLHYAFNV